MGMLVGLSFASVVDADPPSSMAQWKMANFSTEELSDGTSDDLASPSGDGVSNLLKYALNLDPRVRHFSPLTVAISPKDGKIFSIQFTRNPSATDIAYIVETSNDLRTWNSVSDCTDPVVAVNNEDGTQTLTVQDKTVPPAGANRQIRFMRLRVVRKNLDTDGDGLPDDWELACFGQTGIDPNGDADGDGFTHIYEFENGLNPILADGMLDLDGDGIPNQEDARPANPALGRLTITITSPGDGAVLYPEQ